MDLQYHHQELLDSSDQFLQEVWNASSVQDGLSRLLLPQQHRGVSEAISLAYRWSCLKLHPDKFRDHGECWERVMGYQLITNWYNKEMFLAQKREFVELNQCHDWNHFDLQQFPAVFVHRPSFQKRHSSGVFARGVPVLV